VAFDPSDQVHPRFNGYAAAAFPDSRDAELDAFVSAAHDAGPAAVQSLIASASTSGRRVLGAYAEREGSRAVRDANAGRLAPALIALVIGGMHDNDLEALVRMPIIEDSAGRLGLDLAVLFGQVADVVGHPGSVNLMLWLARSPEDRTLDSMGFEAQDDEEGFRYVWTA
jgi:hypothetical protein